MTPPEKRLIELVMIGKHRPLTAAEAKEWEESRQYVINREWKIARLFNLMYAARVIKDWHWFSELANEYKRITDKEVK